MKTLVFDILILLVLILGNGLFAMTEIAMVSVRRERLRQRAEKGDARAKAALEMAESPNRMLSTVQIGITLIGVVAGVYGGATLAGEVAEPLAAVPGVGAFAQEIAIVLVVGVITFLSLVVGELAPKRIGLAYAESLARYMAGPMDALATLFNPLIRVLGWSTDAVLKMLPLRAAEEPVVTEDEVRGLMQEGLRVGAFRRVESEMVSNVLELDRLTVQDIMTPKPKIIWLNQDDRHEAIWHKIVVSHHSQFPVYAGSRDHVVGMVSVKAIYANLAAGAPVRLRDLMVRPLIVPESQIVLKLLDTFRQTGHHAALVADEFGSITGMVTLIDVMESVVGDFRAPGDRSRPEIRKRGDGTWLADGLVEIERVEQALPGFKSPDSGEREYKTLAGFVMKRMGHVPHEGEAVAYDGYLFEVLDMDGPRIDKVLVAKS